MTVMGAKVEKGRKEYVVRISRSEETGDYFALLCSVQRTPEEVFYWPVLSLNFKCIHYLTGIFAHPRYWFRSLESRVTIATRELMAIVPADEDNRLEDLNKSAAITSQMLRMVSKP